MRRQERHLWTLAPLINSFEIHLGYIGSISDPLVTNISICIKINIVILIDSIYVVDNTKIVQLRPLGLFLANSYTKYIFLAQGQTFRDNKNSASGPLVD